MDGAGATVWIYVKRPWMNDDGFTWGPLTQNLSLRGKSVDWGHLDRPKDQSRLRTRCLRLYFEYMCHWFVETLTDLVWGKLKVTNKLFNHELCWRQKPFMSLKCLQLRFPPGWLVTCIVTCLAVPCYCMGTWAGVKTADMSPIPLSTWKLSWRFVLTVYELP